MVSVVVVHTFANQVSWRSLPIPRSLAGSYASAVPNPLQEQPASHLADTLKWLGVKDFNTRNMLVKDIALHGAREASRALRTYE